MINMMMINMMLINYKHDDYKQDDDHDDDDDDDDDDNMFLLNIISFLLLYIIILDLVILHFIFCIIISIMIYMMNKFNMEYRLLEVARYYFLWAYLKWHFNPHKVGYGNPATIVKYFFSKTLTTKSHPNVLQLQQALYFQGAAAAKDSFQSLLADRLSGCCRFYQGRIHPIRVDWLIHLLPATKSHLGSLSKRRVDLDELVERLHVLLRRVGVSFHDALGRRGDCFLGQSDRPNHPGANIVAVLLQLHFGQQRLCSGARSRLRLRHLRCNRGEHELYGLYKQHKSDYIKQEDMEIQAAWMVSLVCQAKSANNNSTNEFAMFLKGKNTISNTPFGNQTWHWKLHCLWYFYIFLVDFTIQTSVSCGDSSQDVT